MEPITFKRPLVYAFDPQTGEHRGQARVEVSIAALAHDRLEFIAPAWTTETAPPDAPRGSVAVWRGSGWELAPDHRGEVWYQGATPVQITDLSDPVAAGLTREPVVPPPAPRDERAERRAAAMQKLTEATSVGSSFVALKKPIPDHWQQKHEAAVAELTALDDEG